MAASVIVNIFFLIFIIILSVFLFYFFWANVIGAPYVPTPAKIVRELIDLADIKSGDKIADLGSGDARILIAAAQKGAIATGWEINPVLVLYSLIKIYYLGLGKKVVIHRKDYRKSSLKAFNKLFLYSISDKINIIGKLIQSDMAKGSLVISYKFKVPHLRLKYKTPGDIYVYTV